MVFSDYLVQEVLISKKKYVSLILSQEQGWFDKMVVFELATQLKAQLEYVELGLGENLGRVLVDIFFGTASPIFAFFGSWKLNLFLLSFSPISATRSIFK